MIPDILVGPTGVVAMIVAWTMAGVVYFIGRPNRQIRLLAPLLLFEGLAMGTSFGLAVWAPNLSVGLGMDALNIFAALVVAPLYLLFLGTLDSPLSRPFAWRPVRWTLIAYLGALLPLWFVFRHLFIVGATTGGYVRYDAVEGPASLAALMFLGIVLYYGLAVAISNYLRAPRGSQERRRARYLVLAFGTRDIITGTLLVSQGFVPFTETVWELHMVGFPLSTLLFVTITTYAVLKARLFDIDLRLKVAFRRSTLAAIFAIVFFVASEAAEAWIGIDGFWGGLAVASLATLALRPLHRWTTRFVDVAMPSVQDTDEYRLVRKREVYLAAVESALVDGSVSERERAILHALQAQLELAHDEVQHLERQVVSATST